MMIWENYHGRLLLAIVFHSYRDLWKICLLRNNKRTSIGLKFKRRRAPGTVSRGVFRTTSSSSSFVVRSESKLGKSQSDYYMLKSLQILLFSHISSSAKLWLGFLERVLIRYSPSSHLFVHGFEFE